METLETFLKQLSTPVLVCQQDNPSGEWRIQSWNPAFQSMWDGSQSDLIGKTPDHLIQVDARAQAPLIQLKTIPPETHLLMHTGLIYPASQQALRVKVKYDWIEDGRLLIWIEPFYEDMALTQAHADFVSTVSHEFRTPLTSIKGFADTLLRYGTNLDTEQQKRFISIIKHQADRLTRLVENLLTVSKIGAQRNDVIFRPIGVKRSIERIVQSIEAKLPEPRRFKIEIPENLPEVWADPDKFEQVLMNLIDNGAKYSYPHSEVTIRAFVQPEHPDQIQIDVSDQGVGIPEEHLPNIFNKFSRIDNPLTREVEGTGLGLYITKSLTHAMGGQISVVSTLDKGSTFTVVLPVASPQRQTETHLHEGLEAKS